ncbi:MAG: hypothetical protein GY708_21470 [Actinomycetia bacterium]|nr:hypothetical protein [Actinomycetes bacterium]
MTEQTSEATDRHSPADRNKPMDRDSGRTIAATALAATSVVVAAVWATILTIDPAATIGATPGEPATDSVVLDVPTGATLTSDIDIEIETVVEHRAQPGTTATDAGPVTDFSGHDIRIVGDSLALSAADELSESFNVRLHVDAESGRALNGSMTALTEAGRGEPDLVVIGLGTNDWDGPTDYGDRIDKALGRVETAGCVVWVNAQEFRDGLTTVNEAIDTAARRHGFAVARWSDLAGSPDLHLSDGYHLSPNGQALYADLVVATAAVNCQL